MRFPGSGPVLLAVASLAGAALAYEIAVARLLAITHWAPLGATLWSVAALGSAASGAMLCAFRAAGGTGFVAAFSVNAALFGLSCLGGAAAAGALTVAPLDLLTAPPGWLGPVLLAGILGLPLFFATNGLVLAMTRHHERLASVYAGSLMGAGLAGIGVTAILFVWSPGQVLGALALLGFAIGWASFLAAESRPRWLLTILVLGSVAVTGSIARIGLAPAAGADKASSRWLGVPGARTVAQRTGPLGWLQVIDSPLVPHYAPGLSLQSRAVVPEQLAVFSDGASCSVINRVSGAPEAAAYLDELPSALPYHLLAPRPSVLILGAAGGSAVLQALAHDAARVDAVEPNPQLIDLVRETFGDYAGHLYDDPRVGLHIADPRGFVRGADARWNLIQLPLAAGPVCGVGAARGLGGRFAYTVEAVVDDLRHLEPGGILAMTGSGPRPPRDGVKSFAMALAALERLEVPEPARRLAWVRSWQVTILIVKNGVFSAEEIERIRRFNRRRSFDEAYLPAPAATSGKAHRTPTRSVVTPPALALIGPLRADFVRGYPYRVEPPSDDKPYFDHFFRWSEWRGVRVLLGIGDPFALDLLEYPLRAATLVLVCGIAIGLVMLPVGGLRRPPEPVGRRRLVRTAAYFASIGFGGALTLRVYVEHLSLYLGHPIYAVPVVLAGLLVFGGIGSRLAGSVPRRTARGRALLALSAVVVWSLAYQELLRPLLAHLASLYLALKLLLVLIVIAPPALCLGLLLPLGMKRLSYDGLALVPWAFSAERGAAAIGPVFAALFALEFGQAALQLVAAVCYGVAALAMP